MNKSKNLQRPTAVLPNGIGIGTSDDEMVVIDFVGALDEDGQPKEFLGSYVLSFKRAAMMAEQIKEVIDNASNRESSK